MRVLSKVGRGGVADSEVAGRRGYGKLGQGYGGKTPGNWVPAIHIRQPELGGKPDIGVISSAGGGYVLGGIRRTAPSGIMPENRLGCISSAKTSRPVASRGPNRLV